MGISSRIKEFIQFKGFSVRNFEKSINCSVGVIQKCINADSDIGSKHVSNILLTYNEINPNWLLIGEGKMLVYNVSLDVSVVEKKHGETLQFQATKVSEEQEQYSAQESPEGTIPLVDLRASAGWGGSSWAITEQDVKAQYVIPKFQDKKVDFMIEVYGSSMYPKYNSGDIIACKIIKQDSFIQWNKVHVVATKDQGILVKRLKKSEDANFLLCHSDNKDYEPFLIPIEEIEGLAMVIGVIRLE